MPTRSKHPFSSSEDITLWLVRNKRHLHVDPDPAPALRISLGATPRTCFIPRPDPNSAHIPQLNPHPTCVPRPYPTPAGSLGPGRGPRLAVPLFGQCPPPGPPPPAGRSADPPRARHESARPLTHHRHTPRPPPAPMFRPFCLCPQPYPHGMLVHVGRTFRVYGVASEGPLASPGQSRTRSKDGGV